LIILRAPVFYVSSRRLPFNFQHLVPLVYKSLFGGPGLICTVMDGPYRLPCRTCQELHAQLLCIKCTEPTVMTEIMHGRPGTALIANSSLTFFLQARVCWPLICLCRPFCIFEKCLLLNQRAAVASRRATNLANHLAT
jgi:hypothetical protein